MRLEATCNTCGRTFLLVQILPEPDGTGGRCPFCGARFGRHYLAMLPEAVRTAETAADRFATAVRRLNEIHPGFRMDVGKLLAQLQEEVAASREDATGGAA